MLELLNLFALIGLFCTDELDDDEDDDNQGDDNDDQ